MSISPKIEVLTAAEMAEVDGRQARQQSEWRSLSGEGQVVRFLDIDLQIDPGVFPPKSDTELLARNLKVPSGAKVADIGTGTGALAIHAALMGAETVLALDISELALANARHNVKRLSLSKTVEVRRSDALSAVGDAEIFDVIVANLPGRNKTSHDEISATQWDTKFQAHKALFKHAKKHLRPNGRIYMVKANYPDLLDMLDLLEQLEYTVREIGYSPPRGVEIRAYHALEITVTKSGA